MDLKGRLSNPLEIAETLVAQRSQPTNDPDEGTEMVRIRRSDVRSEGPREEEGRLSNPPLRRLSPADVHELIAAYEAGATISQLAADLGVHRTTVAAHLDRHQVPRHHEQTACGDCTLREAAPPSTI